MPPGNKELPINPTAGKALVGIMLNEKASLQRFHAVWFTEVLFPKGQNHGDGDLIGGWRG